MEKRPKLFDNRKKTQGQRRPGKTERRTVFKDDPVAFGFIRPTFTAVLNRLNLLQAWWDNDFWFQRSNLKPLSSGEN